MDKEEILNSIFENDPLGILEIKAKNPVVTPDDRLRASFEEINNFFEKHNREPELSTDISRRFERSLCSRLNGIRKDFDKIEALKQYDRFNLLQEV